MYFFRVGSINSLLLLGGYTNFQRVEEIELFRVLVVRFVLSFMVLEISLP